MECVKLVLRFKQALVECHIPAKVFLLLLVMYYPPW